jgi:hypothetical protein
MFLPVIDQSMVPFPDGRECAMYLHGPQHAPDFYAIIFQNKVTKKLNKFKPNANDDKNHTLKIYYA